jgi:uncharacterized protein YbaR (Trm112 family)
MWKCPNCNNEIESLQYHVNTQSSEYGTAELSEKKQERGDIVTDYNSDDYGDSDWDGSPEYTCPECDNDVSLNELIWVDEDDEEENNKPKPEPEPEETLHKIILPENNIIKSDLPRQAEDSIICKNCRHIFVIEETYRPGYGREKDEEIFECPKCSTSTTLDEYKKLLTNGYF